jgi:hypothetical protein
MIRNRVFIVFTASLVLFWPLAWLIPIHALFDFVNALAVVLGLFVLTAYAPGVVRSIRSPPEGIGKAHYLILGIFVTWVAMVGRTAWLWWWRWQGEPQGGMDHPVVAFLAYLVVVGGALHLLAPRVLDGIVPRSGWGHLALAFMIGLVLGGVIDWIRP